MTVAGLPEVTAVDPMAVTTSSAVSGVGSASGSVSFARTEPLATAVPDTTAPASTTALVSFNAVGSEFRRMLMKLVSSTEPLALFVACTCTR